jgi:cAMP phosphodiesterase
MLARMTQQSLQTNSNRCEFVKMSTATPLTTQISTIAPFPAHHADSIGLKSGSRFFITLFDFLTAPESIRIN